MKITDIQLCSYNSVGPYEVRANFAVKGVNQSQSYIIVNSTGLDPDEIVSSFYETDSFGIKNYTLRPKKRTVDLMLRLNPNYARGETASSLREYLYKLISFNKKATLELRFMDGLNYVASLFGIITKVQSPMFNQTSEVQLTLECPDSFMYNTTYTDFTPSHVDDSSLYWNDLKSTAPHGFKMDISLLGAFGDEGGFYGTGGGTPVTSVLQFTLMYGADSVIFVITYPFLVNDRIYFSSEWNNRYLYLIRTTGVGSPVTINLSGAVSLDSIWPIMFPGINHMVVAGAPTGFRVNKISYKDCYWGV